MPLLYHAYVYLEFLILACTIYILAPDKLIRELIGDRLLELNKYVTIDSLSKRIIVDKTTLGQDGYKLVTH